MKLRLAKKIGRSTDQRHRRGTVKAAASRFICADIRRYGIPGNFDCWMAMLYGYPNFGGFEKDEK